jgi:Icc-related predicted phosphoesterase
MKFSYMSDLHLEFSNNMRIYNRHKSDALILAGDIFTAAAFIDNPNKAALYKAFLNNVSGEFDHVLYTDGNHEGYGWQYDTNYHDVLNAEFSKYSNITFLNNTYKDFYELDEYGMENKLRVLGAALWTDFDNADPLAMLSASHVMNDYRVIKNFTPEIALARHYESKEFLFSNATAPRNIVISHHAPTSRSVSPWYRGDKLNSAYHSNLENEILDSNIQVWVHGHMHSTSDYMVGNTRVLANPYGYKNHDTNRRFSPEKTFEV